METIAKIYACVMIVIFIIITTMCREWWEFLLTGSWIVWLGTFLYGLRKEERK